MEKQYMRQNTDLDALHTQKSKKKKARKRKRIKFLLKFFFWLVLLTAIIVFITVSSFFNIKTVNVYGTKRLNADNIKVTAGVMYGVNGFKQLGQSVEGLSLGKIFLLRYQRQEKTLKDKYPYIKNVKVVYRIPQKVDIKINEREPAVKVKFNDKYLLIDEEGFILEQLQDNETTSVLELKGLDLKDGSPGHNIGQGQKEKIQTFFELLDKLKSSDKIEGQEPKIVPILKSVNLGDSKGIRIIIQPDLMVNLGKLGDIDNRRLEILRYLYKNNVKDGKGYLDFSSSPNPNYEADGYEGHEN